ncbi:hypothetical protein V2J09_012348 [Rumex salicifolius]
MGTPVLNTRRRSLAMERTGQWIFTQDIPADIIVEVGEANFPLHKFMLVAKSNYIRKMIIDSNETDLARIDLSDIPGGTQIFEKAAKFCYGVNFEITIHNVAALRCAAEYLEMIEKYCEGNLGSRTEDFLNQVALKTLSGAIVVLKSCEELLPMAENIGIVERCVDVISSKSCSEASFPSRSPPNWWAEELTTLSISYFSEVIASMKSRAAKPFTVSTAITTYTERALRDLVRDHSGNNTQTLYASDSSSTAHQRDLLETLVALFPTDKTAFSVNFLCTLLRCATFLSASSSCVHDLEKRVAAVLDHATVDDLLVLSVAYDGEGLFDLESVRRIVAGFVAKEKSVDVFNGGDFREVCSSALQRVAKTVDAYLGEIATYAELGISKFNGIANLVPKNARAVDDNLYRAIDIYLKAHPNLDEIEREKVCSSMDPLKLSYEARLHASQNKRLPVQIVLHALYYDQLKLRSGGEEDGNGLGDVVTPRNQALADASLAKENESLRIELLKMKMFISDIQKNPSQVGSSKPSGSTSKKPTFFNSVSKKLGRLNPFKNGSKDTSNIDEGVDTTKPRRRRFSIS